MKQLTLQILLEQKWQDIAQLTLIAPDKGPRSPCKLGYELDYSLQWLERDDEHACSLTLPVQLMANHESDHWFGFLDDIVPAGAARRHWVRFLGLNNLSEPAKDSVLLEKGTIAPVGNLRIKESLPVRDPRSTLHLRTFPIKDVVERNSEFLEYAQEMGAISGGATGAGGEAPKLLLRLNQENHVWIDTFQDDHSIPDGHFLVKFPRGQRTKDDCDILRAEYHFYHELTDMGFCTIDTQQMQLLEGEHYPSLWLPRFDTHWDGSHWQRYGLESVYSILNKPAGSYLNHFEIIRTICSLMQKRSATFDTERFVCDWICRDLLNIAFANTDNHGRNSALLKKPDDIWLSPIYDFAPMKADREGITRTTKWGSPYEEGGEYRWQEIAEQLADLCPAEKTMATLKETAQMLTGLKTRLEKRGVSEQILKMGFDYLDEKLKRWGLL